MPIDQAARADIAALQAIGMSKRYRRGDWALRDVNLAVPWGSITALVGPNGAGKSTLIKAWMGFERPTAGRALVAGQDPRQRPGEALPQLAYVPQTPVLYRELSVKDHIEVAAHLRGIFDRDLARRRLQELGIPLAALAGELSGGQAAQVYLTLALGSCARILLLDEPVASLDPLARREFLDAIFVARDQDMVTVVLSSHLISDVEFACDRLIVLGHGSVLLDSTTEDALRDHRVVDARDGDLAPAGYATIATVPGSIGRMVCRRARDAAGPRSSTKRPASLEDIVLAYLVRGRADKAEKLAAREAA